MYILISIKHEYFTGGGNSIAICTLWIDLLQTIAASPVMHTFYKMSYTFFAKQKLEISCIKLDKKIILKACDLLFK